MNLQDWKTIVDIVQTLVTSIAVIVSAIWAYQKFYVQAEHETAINVGLTSRVLPTPIEDVRLIEIRVTLANQGKVPCQIDLDHSWIKLSTVAINEDGITIEWMAVPYFEATSFKSGLLNIPAGSKMDIVELVAVHHPETYRIDTFFAQTEKAGRQFYRRVGQSFPSDWFENPSGWDNALTMNTDFAQRGGNGHAAN